MKWLVLFHVLGATVWAGGHLILSIGFLPEALKAKDISIILNFEKRYERIGIPALGVQVITGIWMALLFVPFQNWWHVSTSHHILLWIKLGLLVSTIGLAIHARFFIIPKLNVNTLSSLAFHITLVTVLAVGFVLTGLSFRYLYL
ncbi:MAG: CopD family protein [Cyclobacteriaceae bacterium]|nr:CopD family protein [Cyclobacteriaceae bacterium]